MKAIVCVDRNWAIGKNGKLLYHIPMDMAQFRELTYGKTIIYGRKTLETLPNKKPLVDRKNIILSRNQNFNVEGAEVLSSVGLLRVKGLLDDDDAFVVGGQEVYRELIRYCKEAYVTEVDDVVEGADAFFPDLYQHPNWALVDSGYNRFFNGKSYHFNRFVRF